MAAITNTFKTSDAVGNREELSNVIDMITPEDTPIYSKIGTGSCDSIHPEWETDVLRAPGANIVAEGDEYAYGAVTPPTRVGNYTQIMRDSFIVSRSQNKVDNAGKQEKVARQKVKLGKALRKDVELAIVTNNGSKATDPREFGGLPTWLTSNVSRGATGANGGYNSGTGVTDEATDGTQRAMTRALVDDVLQSVYESGGDTRHIVVSPYNKRVFATFMSDANVAPFRYAASKQNQTAIHNVEVYLGPLGEVMVVPNRVMSTAATARNAFLIDPDSLSFDWLRPFAEDTDVSRTGDAEKCVVIGEGTLRVRNQAANGVVADLFGLTAST